MQKRILPSTAQLKTMPILPVDWVMVLLGIVWLIILWVYGETPWRVIILGFGTIVWWGVGRWWITAREKTTQQTEFALSFAAARWRYWWIAWIVVVVFNVFTSQILVQSVQRAFWWVMSALWFWWWSSLVNHKLRNWLASQILCIGLLILVVISWLTAWFRPSFMLHAGFDMNPSFILPFFGHHHIAALIVLIWPLWWAVKQHPVFDRFNFRYVTALWLAVLVGTVWFAFSRSAWLAVLLQAGVFCWLYKDVIRQNLRIWLLSGGIFVMLLLTGFLLKDLMRSQAFTELPKPVRQLCYQWWAPESLCSVAPEPRLEYWKQAVVVWREFLWFGSGLDTFGQVAKRWQISTLQQAQYPHQVFLQVLSEQGLVGFAVWLGFFGMLLLDFGNQLRKKTLGHNWPFFLAIFGALILGNLDFDWQLAGFWWPFLLVVSCVGVSTIKNVSFEKNLAVIIKIGLFVAALSTAMSLLTYVFLITNRADAWIAVWPYNTEWRALTVQRISDRSVWHTTVQAQYRNNPEVWFAAMTDIHDPQERWIWLERLWVLDPWRYWETNPLSVAQKNQDGEQIALVLSRLQQWLLQHPDSTVQKYNPAFAVELFELADVSLQQENWQVAADALQLAQVFDPWVLHNRFPHIAETPMRSEVIPRVLAVFSQLNQGNYGDHLPKYRSWYQQLALSEVDRLLQQRISLVGLTPISLQWLPMTTDKDLTDWVQAVTALGEQSLILLPDPQSRGHELSQKLSALMIEAGDATVSTNNNRVNELYQQAQKIEPWVLNGKLWWFERVRLIKPATQEFLIFAQAWSRGTPERTGYKPQAWMLFYNRVLLLSLRSGQSAMAFESLESLKHYWKQLETLAKR